MALGNWAFATTFVAAIAGVLIVVLIVWYRRPKQDGVCCGSPKAAKRQVGFRCLKLSQIS